jgi:hypothetical protein
MIYGIIGRLVVWSAAAALGVVGLGAAWLWIRLLMYYH